MESYKRYLSIFLAGLIIFGLVLDGAGMQIMAGAKKKNGVKNEKEKIVEEAVEYKEGNNADKGGGEKKTEKSNRGKNNYKSSLNESLKGKQLKSVAGTSMEQTENDVMASYQKDQELEGILNSGKYTEKNPYVEVDPFGVSPLTAMVLFQTKERYAVKVTVRGKRKMLDISGTVRGLTREHRIPVVGMYAGKRNSVKIQLLDKKGKTVKAFTLKIKTKKLPGELEKAVIVRKHTKASAYGLTVVSGFDTPYPFAFDENGEVRWYMSGFYDTYGYFPLSDGRFLLMDGEVCTQTFVKPMSQSVNEMDYMGRVYQTYMVKNGVHHEVIEKTPGGNLLVLTNSLRKHCEDCIQEIDRKTGEVVKTLDMQKIFGKKFMDMVDWAHLNTVSYNSKNHCIIVSVRNCNAVVKLNWDTNKVVWILGDKSMYKGTKLYQYVLKAKGEDFFYQYQQHSSYEVMENLDDNKNTVEIMMFDNHFVSKRPVSTFDGRKSSFVTIYSVNEKKKTVEIWKAFRGVKSKVYSNYRFETDKGRVFFMGGCLKKAWKPGHRKGVIYEFDYASEKLLNTYSLKNTFYRAYELELDWNIGARKLLEPKNPVLGDYYTFREAATPKMVPLVKVTSAHIQCFLKGSFLYVHMENHEISEVELVGEKKSYYFRLAARKGGDEKFRRMQFSTVVSLEGLEADSYQVVVVKNGERQNTGETITLY